ncbi:S-adenosylmethionine sensor upstream of mTORC1-like [Artemia franciscana]|uniref:S-adenosylmethionine sensor upstream of mTORC1 n=1 Tax=Artemia franciscana TaxID=6661 RepID=A0AA88LAW1_ARTSF|nr:hypothetical protein QYM36_005131 [Artemia franciscana]KAK2719548.1 hypothetical protein QYM36_005131 [Artemia franciscana]KAK2719549.1 hypothetical protein QYM36_005131 [Artemia franciscana]KAK2719550.1 hypothetical protein QYM36_005131 [Artemia franciscana]KAK2719551.1 hypothetical protein QYM36_005131 [Artemia franciscana]
MDSGSLEPTKTRDILASFIKGVHKSLRDKCSVSENADQIWKEHCQNKQLLDEYARSMKSLATEYWNLSDEEGKKQSRNNWTKEIILDYFRNEGIKNERTREKRKIENFIHFRLPNYEYSYPELDYKLNESITILDVGSCYNPMKDIKEFDILAVDLAPGDSSVLKCDFLSVQLSNKLEIENYVVKSLPKGTFDCIVFSMLLEYIPIKQQRLECSIKAYELLKTEGLLIIITPDSKHETANAAMIKSWRLALSLLGFSRITYSKLKHIHCMAFRKTPVELELWGKLTISSLNRNQEVSNLGDLMYIPQDLK